VNVNYSDNNLLPESPAVADKPHDTFARTLQFLHNNNSASSLLDLQAGLGSIAY